MSVGSEIAGDDIAGVFDELEGLTSNPPNTPIPVPTTRYRTTVQRVFARFGQAATIILPWDGNREIASRIYVLKVMDRELVGDVKQSDKTIFIESLPLQAAVPKPVLPLRGSTRVLRNLEDGDEQLFTALGTPEPKGINGEIWFYRGTFRG